MTQPNIGEPLCLVSPGSAKAKRLAINFPRVKGNKAGNWFTQVTCPYCNKPAKWVSNAEVYNGKQFGDSYMIWLCAPCGAYVGCHKNTKVPKGTLANKPLRKARVAAHNAIDPLWKSSAYTRKQMYAMLNKHFGMEVHIGEADESMCAEIIKWAATTDFVNYYKKH